MKVGFIVGKFYPPHRGHKYLIETARTQVDRLIVMITHHPSQSIPGEVRLDWLREIHPDCDIRLVPDELEEDYQRWADFTVRYLGFAPDIVFSSENYGNEYATLMGSEHIMVDQLRTQVPISATKIRSSPLGHLEMLEPCVRAWFVKRVVLIGAESTGKTTLARSLSSYFNTNWVAEFGREHWERKVAGMSPCDPPLSWSEDEFLHIAQEQKRREDQAARVANRILICDTNAFATGTWYERYMGRRDPGLDALGQETKCDLYLLTAPDIPFVQDGFRDGEKIRGWMHQRFLEQLEQKKLPYLLIEGDYQDRVTGAIAAVRDLLGQDFSMG